MDNILDHVVVQGQRYDIVSPTAFGDNIETIGSACINPDGYAQGSTFLARLGNEQFYYEATAAITQGSSILEGTNCKKTTVTGREAELATEIETLGETVDSLNEALTNDGQATRDSIAPTEDGTNYSTSYSQGAQFYHNGVLRKVTASSVNTSSAIASTSAAVDSITEQIEKQLYWRSVEVEIYGDNSHTYATGSKDITVANYTPIFVGAVSSNRRNMYVYQAYYNGNTLVSNIYNLYDQVINSTDKTIVSIYVLYKHN